MLIDGKIYFAHSRANTIGDLAYDYYQGFYPIIGLSEERQFSVKDLGDGIPRQYDTEAKFLEFAAKGRNKSDSFEITILSEKHICESCAGVVSQFKEKFPNAKVSVVSGKKGYNGSEQGLKTWIHRKKKR